MWISVNFYNGDTNPSPFRLMYVLVQYILLRPLNFSNIHIYIYKKVQINDN
jgi:hypothetical protein